MEKFWNIFWKALGIALVLTIIVGIIIGLVSRSTGITYSIIQGTIATGLGLCGLIGLVVVPVEMFIEDRVRGGETGNAVE
jgi:hypothetical protein